MDYFPAGLGASMAVFYGEGWDPARRMLCGLMSLSAAQQREDRGLPVAVLIADSRPRAVVNLGGTGCAVWILDQAGRRATTIDYLMGEPHRMAIKSMDQWQHTATDPEHADSVWHRSWMFYPDQSMLYIQTDPPGHPDYRGSWRYECQPDRLWQPRPELGEPHHLLPLVPGEYVDLDHLHNHPRIRTPNGPDEPTPPLPYLHLIPTAAIDAVVDDTTAGTFLDAQPAPDHARWWPPKPMPPADFDAWFRNGQRFHIDGHNVTIRPIPAGMLHLPTGRIVAAEPGWTRDTFVPFTVTVPPGSYPVTLSMLGYDLAPDDFIAPQPQAVRLDISTEPAVSWQLALRPGQNPLLLGAGEYYGFGIDGGIAGFFDEAAAEFATFTGPEKPDYDAVDSAGYTIWTSPNHGANMIIVRTVLGDVRCPAWIGRTTTGEIGAVVLDLLHLREATPPRNDPPNTIHHATTSPTP